MEGIQGLSLPVPFCVYGPVGSRLKLIHDVSQIQNTRKEKELHAVCLRERRSEERDLRGDGGRGG